MKRMTAGIDLGTTNSVIVVPGQFPDLGVVFGDVTVIADEFGRLTHASAVCLGMEGELVVGNDALELARQGFSPIRFVKKFMGTTKTFRLGERELTPEEVSALVLRYLVDFAQKRLHAKIDRAVITHPAYFDGLAIKATRKAGELAGLEVASLLEEPTAAAIACASDDENESLCGLVYDLGGGTFDVTVLERFKASFNRLRCGGNRELGGYNVDRKIALAMLEGLAGKGYKLTIDQEKPERDPRWNTLMYYAERLKCELGRGAPKADVVQPSVFQDDSQPKKGVQLRYTLSQLDFCKLIEPEVKQTIDETRRVLTAAGITAAGSAAAGEPAGKTAAKQIDRLFLVGGSCRIVAIQKRLQDEFGLPAQFDDDVLDLSVAVGAGMVAATLGSREGSVTMGYVPEETREALLVISGLVAAGPETPQIANLAVTVSGGQGPPVVALTGPSGSFLIETPLVKESENHLALSIASGDGKVLFSREFSVWHSGEAREAGSVVRPMLAQAISVLTDKGPDELAKEGEYLPYKCSPQEFKTKQEATTLPITLYQDNVVLTSVELTGFTRPIPTNTKVLIEIEINRDYELKATVRVPDAAIEKTQEIKLTPLQVPSLDQLRSDFLEKRVAFQTQLENSPPGPRTAEVAATGDLLVAETEELLAEKMPEVMRIFMNIRRLDLLTWKLPRAPSLDPPKAELLKRLSSCRGLLPAAHVRQPELAHQRIDKTLDALEAQIPIAERDEDSEMWKQIGDRLEEIEQGLQPPKPPPPAPLLKMILLQAIQEVRQTIRSKSDLAESVRNSALSLLQEGESRVNSVSLANEDAARGQLLAAYHEYVKKAEEMTKVVVSRGMIGR